VEVSGKHLHCADGTSRTNHSLYSQGTAVMFNTVSKLPENIKSRVVGVALYGYTKNKQNKGVIPNYPADRVKVFCPPSDGVCGGKLNVNAGYTFLTEKIKAYKPGNSAAAAASEEE
jgi:hypothetical protein